jgi:hypothetical protein
MECVRKNPRRIETYVVLALLKSECMLFCRRRSFFRWPQSPVCCLLVTPVPPPGDGESAILTFGTCANDHEHRDRQYRWRCTQLIVRKSPGQWRLLAQDCARRLLNSLHFSMIDCNIVSIVTLRKHFTGFCSPRGICTRRM